MDESDDILGTSTLRGILLLGGVAAVAYIGFVFWKRQRTIDAAAPVRPRIIRVPVELPMARKAR